MNNKPDARIDLSMRLMSRVHENSDRRILKIVIEVPDASNNAGLRTEAFITRWSAVSRERRGMKRDRRARGVI